MTLMLANGGHYQVRVTPDGPLAEPTSLVDFRTHTTKRKVTVSGQYRARGLWLKVNEQRGDFNAHLSLRFPTFTLEAPDEAAALAVHRGVAEAALAGLVQEFGYRIIPGLSLDCIKAPRIMPAKARDEAPRLGAAALASLVVIDPLEAF